MNNDLATAELALTTDDLHALQQLTDPITGWHALAGLPIGVLRGLSPGTDLEIDIDEVLEHAADLAIADRVAWLHAQRTGRIHLVLAATDGYLVATLSVELDWAASMRMQPLEHAPRIVSVATSEGVLPVLSLVSP